MKKNLMIIVTGASATGKTVLSENLANKFNLPMISKDEIKELLFDYIGSESEELTMKLGMASFELLYLFTEKLCKTGNTFIVEGNFENKYAAKTFSNIVSKYNYKVLQIYCYAELEVLFDRYMKRDICGDRHPGHIVQISGIDEFKSRIYDKNFKLEIEDSIDIDLDATNFEMVNLQKIYEEIC